MDDTLHYLIMANQMLVQKALLEQLKNTGLTIGQPKILDYLKEHENISVLIITHYPKILQYIKPDYVHVMVNGNIKKTGDASLALEIEEKGYAQYK